MTLDQLAARIRRLESLAMGLRREQHSFGKQGDPLDHAERATYLEGCGQRPPPWRRPVCP
jgi:hypothetical protein